MIDYVKIMIITNFIFLIIITDIRIFIIISIIMVSIPIILITIKIMTNLRSYLQRGFRLRRFGYSELQNCHAETWQNRHAVMDLKNIFTIMGKKRHAQTGRGMPYFKGQNRHAVMDINKRHAQMGKDYAIF